MTNPHSAVCTCLALVPPCTRLNKQTRHSGSSLLANTPDLATAPRINKHSHTARLHTLTHTGARCSLTSTEPPPGPSRKHAGYREQPTLGLRLPPSARVRGDLGPPMHMDRPDPGLRACSCRPHACAGGRSLLRTMRLAPRQRGNIQERRGPSG